MNKKIAMFLIFLLSFSILLPVKNSKAAGFSDIPTTHANYDDIMFLLDKRVIEEASTFGVATIVTREEVAVMIAKALQLDGTPRDTKFSDVPSSNQNSGYIQSAAEAGIINGYDGGIFKSTTQVTRGHMAAFIARAFDLPAGSKTFTDVPSNHTAFDAVKQLAAANITTGYADGTFKPQNNLTRAHISAFIARAIRYQETGTAIPTPAPKPVPTPTPQPTPSPAPQPDLSSGTYVIPGAPTSFKNCTELKEYYPNGVQKGHPAYTTKMDRDNDNWACESK